jgi:hypothetical protein
MTSTEISLIVFALIFGGALLGLFLRRFLPGHHLSKESKELVFNIVVGLMAVMAALVLGLLIAAAQDSFREERSDIMQLSARIIFLDRVLAHYGPDTKEVRNLLRSAVERAGNQMWLHENSKPAQLDATPSNLEVLIDKIQELAPKNETQRALRDEALSIALDLVQTRWLLFVEQVRSIPVPFLIVLGLLVFWFTTVFFGFGLFAPSNLTVIAILFVSTVWVSSAFFLLIELNRPFEGLIHIPSEPMRETLQQLGK